MVKPVDANTSTPTHKKMINDDAATDVSTTPCNERDMLLHQMLSVRRVLAAHALVQHDDGHIALQQQAQKLARLLAELQTPPGNHSDWGAMNNTRTLQTWHKQAQTLHSVRAAMVFPNTRVDQPLTMGWEFDLVKTWNSYATATHILQVWS